MEALKELEQRLGIKPLDFSKITGQVIIPAPSTNPSKKEVEQFEEYVEEPTKEVLTSEIESGPNEILTIYGEPDFDYLSNRWRIPRTNVITLWNQVKDLYQQTNKSTTRDLCREILQGMNRVHPMSKDEINKLIRELQSEV